MTPPTIGPDDLTDIGTDIELPADISREVEKGIATPETYDKRLVQDRTGLMMEAKPEQGKLAIRMLGKADILVCQRCSGEIYRVFCSEVDNILQIVCGNRSCGAVFPPLEVYPVQMNDRIAAEHGLYIPPNGSFKAPGIHTNPFD